MEALHDVVKAGKARYIGASSMWAWQFATMQHAAQAHGWTREDDEDDGVSAEFHPDGLGFHSWDGCCDTRAQARGPQPRVRARKSLSYRSC